MRTLIILTTLASVQTAFAQDLKLKVEPAAVKIVHKIYGEGFEGLRPMNSQQIGTTISVFVSSPKGGIIKVDGKKSKLESFTDDKGKDLLGEKKFGMGIRSFTRISKDGKAGMVEITGQLIPAAVANAIQAKGTLNVAIATTNKTFKSKPFKVKAGEKVLVNGFEYTIKSAAKPGFGDKALQISFQSKNDPVAIKQVTFEDASGKEIKSRSAGSSRFGFGKSYTYGSDFQFDKKIDECVMVLDMWTDHKEKQIPFDVKIGIGGGK